MPSSPRSSSSTSTSSSPSSIRSQLPSAAGGSSRSSKSSWKSEYLPLSRDRGLSLRFMAYAAGASLPTTVKKMTRMDKDAQGGREFLVRDTQLFWVVMPEDRQKRGRSRTSRERTQQRAPSAASSQGGPRRVNSPPEISSRTARWAGGSTMGIVPPQGGAAGGFAGGPGVSPGYGQPAGFSFGVPPVVGLPGGRSMPAFVRKQTC